MALRNQRTEADLARINRRLRRMPRHMKDELRDALEASADELVAMQKRLAPVETGALRDSIHWREGDHELQIKVGAGSDEVFYAGFVEFGDKDTPAHPYFFPTYRVLRKRIRSRASRAVRKAARRK